jgi:hypothetical protein
MINLTTIAILLSLCSAEPTRIRYTSSTLPPVYQNGDLSGYPQRYNPSVTFADGRKAHPHGTPNNHSPWLMPGGVPESQQVASIKELELPAGQKVKVWITRGQLPANYVAGNTLYTWSFPVGTVARVRLFDGNQEFARHVSTKTRAGQGIECWDGEEEIVGKVPSWYASPANCTDCHSDIGKHARVLRPRDENYYNWLRGADGRFSWHPFEPIDSQGKVSQRLRVREAGYIQ